MFKLAQRASQFRTATKSFASVQCLTGGTPVPNQSEMRKYHLLVEQQPVENETSTNTSYTHQKQRFSQSNNSALFLLAAPLTLILFL